MNENISILIAGGAQAQALHLQSLLEQTGFQVTSASDGKEALILLLGGLRPALAIIDIEMPETDGYELCRKIRGDERFKEIFVTLLTRHSDPVDFVRVLECGANSFITKPYDEITLLSRIQYLVSNIIQRRDATDGTEVTVYFAGENYHIAAGRRQILDLLLSTYEKASIQNIELVETQNELIALNERLEKLVLERTAELADANKRLQVELAERKKTEEALAIEKNRFITASRAGRAALWEWEIRSATLEWSDIVDQMLGYEAGELPRTVQAWEELIHPDDYPRVMLALESHLGQEAPYDIEYRVRKKDGSYVWWRDSGACLRDGQGKAYQMSGVCTDITRKKKFQEAEIARISAETASRAKSDFLANMSHELRTPLNSVIGFSEVLMDRLYGPLNDKQEEYVNNIHISGRHLLSLINDILDLSKVESGRMELQLSSFSLKDALNAAIRLFWEKAMKHALKLELEMAAEADTVIEADERKFKQIMFNLLSNAVKFTPDGGTVGVFARLAKNGGQETNGGNIFVEISVTDTGIGIKPEECEKLFQPFSQLVSTYAKNLEGTGLGLALTKKLVELHDGRIWVESESGKGSRFSILIPLKAAPQAFAQAGIDDRLSLAWDNFMGHFDRAVLFHKRNNMQLGLVRIRINEKRKAADHTMISSIIEKTIRHHEIHACDERDNSHYCILFSVEEPGVQRAIQRLGESLRKAGHSAGFTVAMYPADGKSVEELLRVAGVVL